MKQSQEFRRALVLRLLALAATSIPIAAISLTGCSSNCRDTEPSELVRCFTWPDADAGEIGTGGAGGGGATMCPSRTDAQNTFDADGSVLREVRSEGTLQDGACCYETLYVSTACVGGRPFLVNDLAVVAPLVHGACEGSASSSEMTSPDVAFLSADERAKLAMAWARDGQLEHASIASFGRFALSLLAVGAPAELIEEAHRAALDEVRHARLCFGLASAYAGEAIGPGAFPFEGRVDVTSSLAELAARAAEEGCMGETIAACVAAEQLSVATDPAVRRVLEVIVADESRHAELAFRFVAWATRVGGPSVRAAVARVFKGMNLSENGADDGEEETLEDHGRLGPSATSAAMSRALRDVVRPAARRLLEASMVPTPHVAASLS